MIASMIRNMDRHRAEETEEGYEWSMWQVEQLKALEKYKHENQKKYKKQFKELNREIEALIQQARQTGNMQQEIQILEAIKNGFKAKKISKGATAEFFRLNERKLEALIEATLHDMEQAETAILRKANDDYRKAIYNAQVYANTGAGTYEKTVDMATRDMLSRGLNCVVYANGARHTLADYADMAIRTASKRAYLQGEGEKRQEWGISTVIMAKRGNPCPKCLPFVGKVLIDDVWSSGPKDGKDPETGKKYPLMSYAISCGLYHPRCKDSHTTYFPGISTADDTWTKEELEAIGQEYAADQRQQYAKRQEEKFGRLAECSLDLENQKRYAARREEWKRRRAAEIEPKTIQEAKAQAENLGVKYVSYDNVSLDMANEINRALETIPEDMRPVFVGDSASLESYRGAKLPRTSNHFYGVHIDVPPTGLIIGRNETTGQVKYDFEVQGQMIGISKKFNSADKITKSKIAEQKKYVQKHGNRWFFNEDGKSTPYHEMGHVYEAVKGLPDGFERDAERWWHECKCDMLKNPKEAWSEAWGAYHTRNEELPDYIAKYIEEATAKPVAKDVGSDIIKGIKIPSSALSAKNITEDMVDEIQSGIDEILREYDAKIDFISVRDMSTQFPDTPYMIQFSDDSGIKKVDFIINSGFDFDGFRDVVSAGYESGYFAGKRIKDHAIHEMAHAMTGQQYKTVSAFRDFAKRLEKKYVPGVSGYADATKDGFEVIAEAFVRMRNNEPVPKEAKELVVKYVERWRKQ